MQPHALELPFVAPVPRGNDVLVVWLTRSPGDTNEVAFVLDRTAGLLYADASLSGPLGRDARVLLDPITVLTRWSWVVTRSLAGVSVGSVVLTTSSGDANEVRTRLFVEAHAAPYRG